MPDKKVLVLLQFTTNDSWQKVQSLNYDICYLKCNHPNIKVLCYIDDPMIPPGEFVEDGLFLSYGIDEKQSWLKNVDPRNERFIKALDYVYNNYDFDYLYRSGCTSYIDFDRLYDDVLKCGNARIYTGDLNGGILSSGEYVDFVTGFQVIMTKDVVELLVANRDLYISQPYNEDVSVGVVLTKLTGYINWDEQLRGYSKVKIRCLDDLDQIVPSYNDPHVMLFNYKINKIFPEGVTFVSDILSQISNSKR